MVFTAGVYGGGAWSGAHTASTDVWTTLAGGCSANAACESTSRVALHAAAIEKHEGSILVAPA
jgi:hypothetical protein